MSPLFALGFSPLGLLVILIVVLLLFGNRMPMLMRSLGRSVIEFKKGVNETGELEDDEEVRERSKAGKRP